MESENEELKLIYNYKKIDNYIYLDPLEGKHQFTIIFLSGLGGCCDNFLSAFGTEEKFGTTLKNCRIVLPTAPVKKVSFYNKKMACWYNMCKVAGKPNLNTLDGIR